MAAVVCTLILLAAAIVCTVVAACMAGRNKAWLGAAGLISSRLPAELLGAALLYPEDDRRVFDRDRP